MSRHRYRFFASGLEQGLAVISEDDRHHLRQVLRMGVGDTCEVAAGGRVLEARVTAGGLELGEEVRRCRPHRR